MKNSTTNKITGIFLMFFSESVMVKQDCVFSFECCTPSKRMCLEMFQGTKTDLENTTYEKRLKRFGLFNQKKRGRGGTEEGFYKYK